MSAGGAAGVDAIAGVASAIADGGGLGGVAPGLGLGPAFGGAPRCEVCDGAFRIFVCLWGQVQLLRLCALLYRSHLSLLEWLSHTGPRASSMLLSCLMCVAIPDEATMAAVVCSAIVSVWASLPGEVDSGGVFELLVHLNLLAGLCWSLLTNRPACEGWAASAPAVRCLQVLVYAFVALARLNRDYHDVRKSASTVLVVRLWNKIGMSLGLTSRSVDAVGDGALLLVLRVSLLLLEAGGILVPILLIRGNVSLALPIAWLFCMALAFTSAFDFAALLVATMPFWVPAHQLLALRWTTFPPTARLFALCALVPTLLQRSNMQRRARMVTAGWLLIAGPLHYLAVSDDQVWAMPSVAAGACAIEAAQGAVAASADCFVRRVAYFTVAIALLNGVSPYLGLKTQATWTLLSNLHVEGGAFTNHLLIPASCQIFSFTGECVTVTKTNMPLLQEQHSVEGGTTRLGAFLHGFADRAGIEVAVHSTATLSGELPEDLGDVLVPYSVPFFELRRVVAEQAMPFWPDFYIEYMHYGAPHRFEVKRGEPVPGSDLRLASPPPLLLRKFLAFRSAPEGQPGACRH